jgi:hypothetical protein
LDFWLAASYIVYAKQSPGLPARRERGLIKIVKAVADA